MYRVGLLSVLHPVSSSPTHIHVCIVGKGNLWHTCLSTIVSFVVSNMLFVTSLLKYVHPYNIMCSLNMNALSHLRFAINMQLITIINYSAGSLHVRTITPLAANSHTSHRPRCKNGSHPMRSVQEIRPVI